MKTNANRKKSSLLLAACLAGAGTLLGAASPAPAWELPVYLSSTGVFVYGDSTRLAVDGKGRAVAAWVRYDGANTRLEAAIRPYGGAFGAATQLSGAGADVNGLSLAVTKKGNFTAVWDRGINYDTRWLEVADLGAKDAAFSSPTVISSPGEVALSPQIGVDGKGNATVAWTKWTTGEVKAATRPAGETFGTAQTLSPADTYGPVLAVGPKGNAVVAWSQNPDPNVVGAAIRPAGGDFGSPIELTDSSTDTDVLKIAMDAKGNAAIAARNFTMGEIPAGATTSGAWFAIPFDHQTSAVLRYDKSGNLYALYTTYSYNVRLAVKPAGATAFDPYVQVSDPAYAAFANDLIVDKKGNVRVMWSESDGAHSRIKTSKRPKGGTFGTATTLSADGVSGFSGHMVADKKGNVVATWAEDDGAGSNYRLVSSYDPR